MNDSEEEVASNIWYHTKTGGFYTVLFTAINEADLVKTVVYKALNDGTIWLRPYDEFHDGRFQRLTAKQVQSLKPE